MITEKDRKYVHRIADEIWEKAKKIEDADLQDRVKMLISDMHALAERGRNK